MPSAGGPTGGSEAQNAQAKGPEIHIYVDGFDPTNPVHQELVYEGMSNATERLGEGARVIYHPRTGTRG